MQETVNASSLPRRSLAVATLAAVALVNAGSPLAHPRQVASPKLSTPSASGTCAVFHVSEYARPGQAILVRGSGFTSSTVFTITPYSSTGQPGASTTLTSAAGKLSDFGAILTVPSGYSFGVYRIDASGGSLGGGGTTSPNAVRPMAAAPSSSPLGPNATRTAWINRPRIQWSDAGRPGEPDALTTGFARIGTQVRLVGRNLVPDSATPTVTLTDTSSGATIAAAVTAVTDEYVRYAVPNSAVVGDTYSVSLQTDLAGAYSVAIVPEAVRIVAAGSDPYGLGTSWAGDFIPIQANSYDVTSDSRLGGQFAVHDGATNDRDAIQHAIDVAAGSVNGGTGPSTGGQVYLPAGTYNVDDGHNPLYLRPHVVLAGAGASTILKFGTLAPSYFYYLPFRIVSGGSDSGIASLTVQNDASRSANFLVGCDGASDANGVYLRVGHFFAKNVAFNLGKGGAVNLSHLSEAAVEGCGFSSTGSDKWDEGALVSEGARNTLFSQNTLGYRAGRWTVSAGYRNVLEGNAVNVDYADRSSLELGGIEMSYGQQQLVAGNAIRATGAVGTPGTNDGEMLITQSTFPEFYDLDALASATTTTLSQPSSDAWPSDNSWYDRGVHRDELPRSFAALVDGLGLGEWRWAVSHTTSTATVGSAWDVVPDTTTSRYAVGEVSNYQQTWVGNTITGGRIGLQFYNGAIDSTIAANTLTDTGGIEVRGAAAPSSYDGLPTKAGLTLVWDTSVRGNSVTCNDATRAATIGVIGHQQNYQDGLTGPNRSLVLGADVRDNTIVGSGYAQTSYPFFRYDGIEVVSYDDDGNAPGALVNWGTITENNPVSTSSTSYPGYYREANVSVYGGHALSTYP